MSTLNLPSLFHDDSRSLERAFRDFMRPLRWEPTTQAPDIRMDVTEADGVYTVKADIPGVRKDDIHIDIQGSQVTVSAEVKHESEEKKNGRVLHSERSYGFASRVFTLGHEIDRAKAVAKYDNGVLTLTLPRSTSSKTEPLKIS